MDTDVHGLYPGIPERMIRLKGSRAGRRPAWGPHFARRDPTLAAPTPIYPRSSVYSVSKDPNGLS